MVTQLRTIRISVYAQAVIPVITLLLLTGCPSAMVQGPAELGGQAVLTKFMFDQAHDKVIDSINKAGEVADRVSANTFERVNVAIENAKNAYLTAEKQTFKDAFSLEQEAFRNMSTLIDQVNNAAQLSLSQANDIATKLDATVTRLPFTKSYPLVLSIKPSASPFGDYIYVQVLGNLLYGGDKNRRPYLLVQGVAIAPFEVETAKEIQFRVPRTLVPAPQSKTFAWEPGELVLSDYVTKSKRTYSYRTVLWVPPEILGTFVVFKKSPQMANEITVYDPPEGRFAPFGSLNDRATSGDLCKSPEPGYEFDVRVDATMMTDTVAWCDGITDKPNGSAFVEDRPRRWKSKQVCGNFVINPIQSQRCFITGRWKLQETRLSPAFDWVQVSPHPIQISTTKLPAQEDLSGTDIKRQATGDVKVVIKMTSGHELPELIFGPNDQDLRTQQNWFLVKYNRATDLVGVYPDLHALSQAF